MENNIADTASLAGQHCTACRKGTPPAAPEEIASLLARLPDWQVVEEDGIARLERVFVFSNFAQALSFTIRVGKLAEQAGHHPAILTEWGRVRVSWWTHIIGGLHRNDFIMAARTDRALAE